MGQYVEGGCVSAESCTADSAAAAQPNGPHATLVCCKRLLTEKE